MYYAVIDLVSLNEQLANDAIERATAWNGFVENGFAYIPCANLPTAKHIEKEYSVNYVVAEK